MIMKMIMKKIFSLNHLKKLDKKSVIFRGSVVIKMQLFVELQTARSSRSMALDRAVNIINKYFDRFLAF